MTDSVLGVSGEVQWPKALLVVSRPIWQIAIILTVLFQVQPRVDVLRGVFAVSAAFFIAADILFASNLDDRRWPTVQAWVLHVETVVGSIISIVMIGLMPLGPASLFLLPTLLSYTWLNRSGSRSRRPEVWLGFLSLCLYVGAMEFSTTTALPAEGRLFRTLLFGLYAVVIASAWLLTWLLQRQWQERKKFELVVHQLQQQSEQLSRVNEQVNTYATRVYDLAAADERNRIAGEIHDTVAHRLTALLVQLQGARRMMEAGESSSAAENMKVSEELARESLDEVRRSVRAIRRDAGDEGLEALRRLTLHYASLTGMTIHFRVAPDIHAVPGQLMAMLYRVIQEGLTNAQRHGRATQVEIDLVRTGSRLVLKIVDNGKGAAQPDLGFGLSSMRNRLLQYGGDIRVDSQPGSGFQLELTLPLWGGVSP